MTSSHYQHAYLLKVHNQPTWSRTTIGLGWLHILTEEEQGYCPHLYMEMLKVQSPDEVQVPLLPRSVRPLSNPWKLEPSPTTTLRMGALQLDGKSSTL